ncbi:hypothetical protein ACEUZ9_000984 [Paracoccus litorisediminis]|uniref:hypothetical protein n=1 Tax=Paracoccus litorisediminis TaxID=2006130 RepID=UPI0037337EF3
MTIANAIEEARVAFRAGQLHVDAGDDVDPEALLTELRRLAALKVEYESYSREARLLAEVARLRALIAAVNVESATRQSLRNDSRALAARLDRIDELTEWVEDIDLDIDLDWMKCNGFSPEETTGLAAPA